LGNPEKEFEKTPHNLGFEVLDYLKEEFKGTKWKKKNLSLVSEIYLENELVFLVKPQTFMNLSGEAVKRFLLEGNLNNENCIVIFDDINLPFGKLRLKLKGSSGGHKGMSSIINVFGTNEIPRLRVGIGPRVGDATIYVLTPLNKEKLKIIENLMPYIKEGLLTYLKNKEKAMQYFNTSKNTLNGL
jgi:PTH1 family peptidyl-tRNA hydrolase